jgi:hypothetical protein
MDGARFSWRAIRQEWPASTIDARALTRDEVAFVESQRRVDEVARAMYALLRKRLARVKPRLVTEIAPARTRADEPETMMSPTTRGRKTARKAAKAKRPAARRKTAAKKVARKVAKKPAARKVAKPARKAAKKAATKRSASKRAPGKASRKTAARKTPVAKSAPRAPAKVAKPARVAKPTARPKPPARRAPAAGRKAAAPQQPAKPELARQHFRELLEAKQQRVKQGPSYPAPNAFTGRPHEAGADTSPPNESASGAQDSKPDVEATYGDGEFAHGRGNQGMRGQN